MSRARPHGLALMLWFAGLGVGSGCATAGGPTRGSTGSMPHSDGPAVAHAPTLAADNSTARVGASGSTSLTISDPQFQLGHNLFSARCQRCHTLPEPARLAPEAWPAEVTGMARKSGLSAEQVTLVSRYLMLASRDARALKK